MRESPTIVMRCLPGGTLGTGAAGRTALGDLPMIGAAMASAAYDPATGRHLIPTDEAGLSCLATRIECARDELRNGLRAIGNLMANASAADIDGCWVVEIGFLIESLASLDEDMLSAEKMVRSTREYLQTSAAPSADAARCAADLEAERLRFEALRRGERP